MKVSLNPDRGMLATRYLKSLAVAKGMPGTAAAFAAAQGRWHNRDEVIAALKAGVGALDRGDADAMLAAPGVDFSDFIGPLTIMGRLQGLRRVPARVRVISQDAGFAGYWVGEGGPLPLSAGTLNGEVMDFLKVGAIAVVTAELLASSDPSAEAALSRELARAAVARMDVSFIDPSNGGVVDVSPASVTNAATPIPSSGSTLAAIDTDLDTAINALDTAGSDLAFAHWVMRPKTALYLSRLRGTGGNLAHPNITVKGGTLFGLPVIVSAHVANIGSPPESYIALVDASQITVADENMAELSLAKGAAIEMRDDPTNSSTTPTATNLVSLFQVESAALKMIRRVNWRLNRSGMTQLIREVDY